MNKTTPSDAVLGISVAANRIEAVLLRPSGAQIHVAGRLTRQRLPQGELVGSGGLATVIPGLKGSDEADFTIQVGSSNGNSGSSSMFLSSEFAGLGVKPSEGGTSAQARAVPFVQPLREILAECRALGYEHPKVAFCVGAPDVSYVELFVARDQFDAARSKPWERLRKPGTQDPALGVDRRRLLDLLAAQHRGGFDEARVAFLPMTPLKEQRRFLAIVPESSEPVTATLEAMLAQHRTLAPSSRILGTELSLYTALVRKSLAPAQHENTAIVRIGGEDTLIVFLAGKELRHFERLRSLTTYDPPETICSRVLLQQDEQKIGELHHVLILSEVRNEPFQEAFRKFYPKASVEPMQRLLLQRGLQPVKDDEDGLRASATPAAGIGLKLLKGWEQDDPFGAVNLLPKKFLRKPKQRLAFAWHTFAMLAVLFGTTFFFTTRHAEQQAQIDRSRQELALNPPDPKVASAATLQARVDSLQQVYRQYTRALHVLDSLLVGSDQWSRTLEKTARATQDLSGVWFESWQPNGLYIRLSGNAKSRTRVAQLANRLDGEIEKSEFEEVNDVRIHPFVMVVPRPIAMPRVAEYLKDAADGVIEVPGEARPAASTSVRRQAGSGKREFTRPVNLP